MKKLALILALTFVVPMAVAASAKAASSNSDLAVGDPMGSGYHRTSTHKRHHKKAADGTSTSGAPAESAKKPAEKAPAKAAEPAK